MGDFLNSLTGDQKTQLIAQATKVVPAIIGFNQANKARNKQNEYLADIKEAEKNRQRLVNPYATLTNPFQNLQVATKAAEMQAEQTDLALASTLDAIRKTGAGGATALAQAALKSKQGVAASIEKQEAQNQKLQAQGQLQVDLYRAKGEADIMGMQEKREEAKLDRLQGLADQEALIRQQGLASGVGSISSMLSGGAKALIKPQANIPTTSNFDATEIANSLTDPSSISQNIQTLQNNPITSSFDTSNMSILNPNTTGQFDVSNLNLSLIND